MANSVISVNFTSWDKDDSDIRRDHNMWNLLLKKAIKEHRKILSKPKLFGIRDLYCECDIQIHMGIPIYAAFPWTYVNWLWMGARIWEPSYDGYLSHLDLIYFDSQNGADEFRSYCSSKGLLNVDDKIRVLGGPNQTPDQDHNVMMDALSQAFEQIKEYKPSYGVRHFPPVLERSACPPISIITPTFQRKKLMEIAYHNLLATDYPHSKIEWIVVEDNDKSPHVMKESLASFQQKAPSIQIRYLAVDGRRSVGEKRNIGIQAASHEWIHFMDDDDHYPPTSFRRRMAWLLKSKIGKKSPRVIGCTTIALYDLKQGVSAVNVPPIRLPLSQRISEATLSFHRSLWEERKFPEISVAEGESWIEGREEEMVEIPPQQIIVAFTHGQNQSSRRLPPPNQSPVCFWNFPKEYLVFIHGLVGVDVSCE